jgi:hypothetical protein
MSTAAYTAVWRPGDGAQWWNPPLSLDQFKTKDKAYFDQGLRLMTLSIRADKYMGVWQPGNGAQWWTPPLPFEDFKATDKAYFDQGLRLVALSVDGGKYAGVWRPGSGAQWTNPPLGLDAFKEKDKAYFAQGLRLMTLRVRGGKYTGVWRPGSGAQWWTHPLPYEEFKTKDKAYFDQGLRLASLSVDGGKYAGVWRPGSGPQWLYARLCLDELRTESTAHFAQGFRLHALERDEDPVGLYRLPFDHDDDWKLFNGNFDDPSGHGHPDTGLNHGNNQKYAFDFAHDWNSNNIGEAGQYVRAARSGTVYALQKSESGNAWQTGTTEETVKRTGPYPAGYSGVGNFVVVRHVDGTFGTYWHLKKNSITVAVGDSVSRGELIGVSGNTGNSSTPHLHFDVRSGWSLGYPADGLEYPSVRIAFQDKNHACWIPRVGDVLASNNS